MRQAKLHMSVLVVMPPMDSGSKASGAMYEGVPFPGVITPLFPSLITDDKPKSAKTALSKSSNNILPGFKS